MLVLCLPFPAGADGESAFISVLEDLPLMSGLDEDEAAAMVFESENGRVAEATAAGALLREDIISFYSMTLPQLGWEKQSNLLFSRDNEILKMEITGGVLTGEPTQILFSLTPASQ